MQDPAHSNSAAFRTVYRFGAGLWLTLLVWQGAVMPIRSWVTSGFSIMAVVLVVWGMTGEPRPSALLPCFRECPSAGRGKIFLAR